MKYLSIIFLSLLLFGCDTYTELVETQKKAQTYLKAKYNLDAEIGFSYSNGSLEYVTVIFKSEDVLNKTVKELDQIAVKMVSDVFEKKAEKIVVQLFISPK